MYELSGDYQTKGRNNKLNKKSNNWYISSIKSLKNKIFFILKILLILSISALLIVVFQFESISSSEPNMIEVKVVEGDNLWKIADRYYGDNTDLRKKIFKIKKINKLETAMLKPGQKIIIPVSEWTTNKNIIFNQLK